MTLVKRHGPDLRVAVVPLAECGACLGKGVIRGVFHQMACAGCNGSGMVSKETGDALEAELLVLQLRMRLSKAHAVIRQQRACMERAGLVQGGAENDYEGQRNRRGIGGGNWTGD